MRIDAHVRLISKGPYRVAESPLWDAAANCLWWVDAGGTSIYRHDCESGALSHYDLDASPSALALRDDGLLVVAAGHSLFTLDPATGETELIADIEAAHDDMKLNDGAVDRQGRLWIGSLHASAERRPVGQLYCMSGPLVRTVIDGLRTQNGTAFSPDGRTLYLADSHPNRCVIWRYELDEATGELSDRAVFHRPEKGRPDGAAMDVEGCYWFAAIDASEIVRLSPGGEVIGRIELPAARPTKPAFGGSDMTTLFITTMSLGLERQNSDAETYDGAVLAVKTGICGHPQPPVAAATQTDRIQSRIH